MQEVRKIVKGKPYTHYIFESREEFKHWITLHPEKNENNQDINNIPYWNEPDIKAMDWIMSDNGRILQCIKVTILPNKKYPSSIVHLISTPVAKAYWYKTKNGYTRQRRLIINLDRIREQGDIYSFAPPSTDRLLGKSMTSKKRLFVYFLCQHGDPERALKEAMEGVLGSDHKRVIYMKSRSYMEKAIRYLKDPQIKQEIQRYMPLKEFKDKLRAAFEERNLNESRLAKELDEGLESAKKGGLAHKQYLELAIKAIANINDNEDRIDLDGRSIPARLQQVTTATYEQLPEPEEYNKSLGLEKKDDVEIEKNKNEPESEK